MFIDIHAHSSNKSCFIYGNVKFKIFEIYLNNINGRQYNVFFFFFSKAHNDFIA